MITQNVADLRAALPMGGVLMGLDPGTKTIGVALCDAGWHFATAGQTVIRRKFAQDKAALAQIVTQRGVKGLVIGLPLNMDDSISEMAEAAKRFARRLEGRYQTPFAMMDERLTSFEARETATEDKIDAIAARLILESFMNQAQM